jgi:ketosteroid isomerase-like protein
VDGLQALCVADVELVPMRAALEGTSYRGPDAVSRMFADFDESCESLHYDVDEIQDAGEAVLVTARLRARGRATGVDVDAVLATLMRFRGRQVSSFRTYTDPDEARRAAGLSDQRGPRTEP